MNTSCAIQTASYPRTSANIENQSIRTVQLLSSCPIITSFIVVLAIQFIKLFPNEYESRILALISAISSGIGVAMIALMKRYIIGEVSSDHPAENDYSNSQSFVGLQDNTMENELRFDDEDQRLAASLGVASQHATLARLKSKGHSLYPSRE
jgi:hypothetical protein